MKTRGAILLFLLAACGSLRAENFVVPASGTLYMQCVGGSAGATSQFGLGTSPSNFVPYLTGLPGSCPDKEVSVGAVSAGQTVQFGISTAWNGQTYWAFSSGTDQGSIVSFSDVCNTLGMGGNNIQQTSSTTWVMHLNDAAHYTLSQCEANNILIQLRVAAASTQRQHKHSRLLEIHKAARTPASLDRMGTPSRGWFSAAVGFTPLPSLAL
jgi:hypothetical protein